MLEIIILIIVGHWTLFEHLSKLSGQRILKFVLRRCLGENKALHFFLHDSLIIIYLLVLFAIKSTQNINLGSPTTCLCRYNG